MFIQTEDTPNPQTLKFLPGKAVLEQGTANFANADSAQTSPLAQRIFGIEGITGVYFGADFITVTKEVERDWASLKTFVLAAIMDHYTSGQPVLLASETASTSEAEQGEDSEIISQIKELLEQRVRPAVAQDGGDIIFRSFEDGIVYLEMLGACAGCPSSTATLKMGVENMLRHYIPEVTEVRPAY